MSALHRLPLRTPGDDAPEGCGALSGAGTEVLQRLRGAATGAATAVEAAVGGTRAAAQESVSAVGSGAGSVVHRVRSIVSVTATAVEGTARTLCSPTGLAGVAVEALWMSTHVALYPFGLAGDPRQDRRQERGAGYRIEHLAPVQRGRLVQDVEAAGTPILLVHGIIDNQSVFTLLRRGLRRRGFDQVTTMNYSILTGDVRVAAARLAEQVEAIVAQTGYERIHVVGHSMGGLIARYYVTRLGGDERVHTLVTLGSPHAGTYSAYAWPGSLTRQMRPGSPLLRELELPVPGCRTRFICYWSDLDQVMLPQRTAALEHPDLAATNILLHGVGHTSIPIMSSVVHGISQALAHLDEDGSAVTGCVRPLRSTTPGSGH
ncbi:MAG: alpha/beta fold hydrolase [Actinomycetota bacterium]|nr:alpha/beta fold hydrolase [Actinomycetota bacterium]